jgi:predicted transcriptional regulator
MTATTLFPIQQAFRIIRLTGEDATRTTDSLKLLEELLSSNEEMYPNITRWFRHKVIQGLRDGSRIAYIGFEGELPVLTAVVKRGENAKFCHLKIASEFRDIHLGEIFFTVMALEVRNLAKEIYFTLPGSLWQQRKEFFSGFGFRDVQRARKQYRLFDDELQTSAPFIDVWRSARQRLPQIRKCFAIDDYSMAPSLLLAIKPAFARRLLSGDKTIEVRRKFHRRWEGARAAIYASRPEQALIGEATIEHVQSASPTEVWDMYQDRLGCSREEFDAYAGASESVVAITLTAVTPYVNSMPVCQFEYLLEEELPVPQSHCEVLGDRPWGKAISIAALLHGCQRYMGAQRPIV